MVVADFALAVKNSLPRLNKSSKSSETVEETVAKLTHLRLHGKAINSIEDLSFCKNLKVLYLHDNNITTIENLNGLIKLRQLYLQNNNIQQIENLNELKELKKLYLNNNAIGLIEGLEGLELEELHIANQRLGAGEKLLIDSRSLLSLAETLQLLDISGNSLDSIKEIQYLKKLKILTASTNQLVDVIKTSETLSNLEELEELDLSNNPFTKHPHYRKCILATVPSLRTFDGKKVSEESKVFLQRLRSHLPENSINPILDQQPKRPGFRSPRNKWTCPTSYTKQRASSMKNLLNTTGQNLSSKLEDLFYNPFWDLEKIRPGENLILSQVMKTDRNRGKISKRRKSQQTI